MWLVMLTGAFSAVWWVLGLGAALVVLPILLAGAGRLVGGPFRRVLVFASGAKPELLEEAKDDEGHFLGLGSMVIITASVAVVSMSVALSVGLHRPWPQVFPFALGYGLVIFCLDRFLVGLPLNPWRFPSTIEVGDPPRQSAVGSFLRVGVGVVPRLLMAVVVAVLIAEPLLLVIFKPEIDSRVTRIQQSVATENANAVRQSADEQIQTLSQKSPDAQTVDADTAAIADLDRQINAATAQRQAAQQLRDNECLGQAITTSAGTSSSLDGCGPRAAQDDANANAADLTVQQLTAQRARLQAKVNQLNATVDPAEARRRGDYNAAVARRDAAVANAREQALATDGLLIRIDALEQLATSKQPYAPPAADGSPAVPADGDASTAVGAFGLTTLGRVVWTLRFWLVLLDTMPVLFKAALALRRRRPYDVVLARHHEEHLSTQTLALAQRRSGHERELYALMKERARERAVYAVGPDAETPPPSEQVRVEVEHDGRTLLVPVDQWLRMSCDPSADIATSRTGVDAFVRFSRTPNGVTWTWSTPEPPQGFHIPQPAPPPDEEPDPRPAGHSDGPLNRTPFDATETDRFGAVPAPVDPPAPAPQEDQRD